MKPLLSVPDASGLAPLELPEALSRQAEDNSRPPPSQDAVSRFLAAMGEPQSMAGFVESVKLKAESHHAPSAETSVDLTEPGIDAETGNGKRGTGAMARPVSDVRPDVSASPSPLSASPSTALAPAGALEASLVASSAPAGALEASLVASSAPTGALEASLVASSAPAGEALPIPDDVSGNEERGTEATVQVFNGPAVQRSSGPTVQRPNVQIEALPVPDDVQVPGNEEQGTEATVQGLNGPTVQRSSGPTVQRSSGPTVQRTHGPAVQRTHDLTNKRTNVQATEEPTPLQAAPVAMPNETIRAGTASEAASASAVALEIDPAAATARTQELVDAALVVADTILVTPSLVRGEGEVTIRLRPTVLDGSEIRIEAKGESLTVALTPSTDQVQRFAEQSQARFAAELSERIPSFQIAIVVNSRQTTARRDLRDETA